MIKRFLKKRKKIEELEKEIENLELQLKERKNDIEFIMNKIIVITKTMTSIKKSIVMIHDIAKNTVDLTEQNQQELQLQEHEFEEVAKTFNIMHQRLQAVEGYYIDKPLKDKVILN